MPRDAVVEIARRSRGTPRIANRLFRRVRDFAQVLNDNLVVKDTLYCNTLPKNIKKPKGVNKISI